MNYIEEASKTNQKDSLGVVTRLQNIQLTELLHGAIGASTEANELLDMLKKHIYYGKEIDYINIEEEVGDLFWYCALICNTIGKTFEEIMEKNIDKLKTRYPNSFNNNDAINRNLEEERKILEK